MRESVSKQTKRPGRLIQSRRQQAPDIKIGYLSLHMERLV